MSLSLLAGLEPNELAIRTAISALVLMSAVIVLAAAIAGTALRHRADGRHSLWLVALAWVIISPAVAGLANRSGLAIATLAISIPGQEAAETKIPLGPETASVDEIAPAGVIPGSSSRIRAPGSDDDEIPSESMKPGHPRNIGTPPPDAPESVHPQPASRGRSFLGGVVLIWMIGVLAGLARAVVGCRQLARFSRQTRPLDLARHGETLALVHGALGVDALPPIVTSPHAREPLAIGLLKPRVVLPEGMAEKVPGDPLRDILVHECAHILRGDTWVGLLQRFAGIVYWPHPLVHYLNGQLARAREEVCDNHVIRFADRCGYARTLVALTESCRPAGMSSPALGFLDARWSLADRVAGLLDPRRIPMTRTSIPMRICLAAALTLAGTAVCTIRLDRPALGDEPNMVQAGARAPTPSAPLTAVWQVKGTVVDEQGKPVTGASVRSSPVSEPADWVKTAADGAFTLGLGGARPFLRGVVAEADGGARVGVVEFDEPRDPGEVGPLKVVLKPARSVRVRVKDGKGAPVPGASVEAVEYVFQTHATTDAQGLATLRVAADAHIEWVIGLKSGAGFDYFENYRTRPATEFPPLPEEVTLTLNGAQSVRVRAVDSAGQPVPGMVFSPLGLHKREKINRANVNYGEIAKVATDAQGVAAFDWFPAEVPGGTFQLRSRDFTCPEPILARRGTAEVTARVLRDTPLSGTVRLPDARPAAGVLVRASGVPIRTARNFITARSGPDGSYRMDVAPGASYMIGVLDETWAAPSLANVVVDESKPRSGLDLTLVKGTLIRGRVTEGPDRRPSAGVRVSLAEQGPILPKELRQGGLASVRLFRESTTDPEGRYHFRVAPGSYQLTGPPLSGNAPIEIAVKDQDALTYDLALRNSPRGVFINGLVVEKTPAGERPVAGAGVYRHGVATGGSPALADEQGRFRMVRVPGEYILYAGAKNGMAGFAPFPEKGDTVKVVVAPATTIRGRVVDSEGKPVARRMVGVAFARNMEDFYKTLRHGYGIDADDQGRFVVKGVPVGAVGEVSVYHRSDATSQTPRTAARFEVPELAPVEIPDLVIPADRPKK
jgi:beta-lactamase regulating signal transducer with metallopeptidase domain